MAFRSRNDLIRILLFAGIAALCATAQSDPTTLLSEADLLADQGNWQRARQLYASAEAEFKRIGDHRKELHARFGRLHGDAEAGSYSAVREQLLVDMRDPV